jgi:hypothetical protein
MLKAIPGMLSTKTSDEMKESGRDIQQLIENVINDAIPETDFLDAVSGLYEKYKK